MGLQPNVGAGLAVLSCIIPVVGPLVFLLIEKKNEFIRYWAAQAFIVSAALFVLSFALGIMAGILASISLSLALNLVRLFQLAAFVLWVVMLIKAFTGKKWDIPVVSNFIPTVLGWFKTS